MWTILAFIVGVAVGSYLGYTVANYRVAYTLNDYLIDMHTPDD